MKRIICAAAMACLPAMANAEIHVITDDANGVPHVETTPSPAMSDVPEIGGKANAGFSYARLWSGMEGFEVFEGHIAPGGRIVSHDGPDTYIGCIVSGHGTMGNDAPDGTTVSRFDFGPGDVIVFGPGTMHHWVNGDEELVFIGVQRRAPADGG
ncbi:cupin domain-containing protein [Antarcticimicrobium luteum]|nr:cupin domain-containing protein [Antarcticimicrobium luteum]